MKIQIIALMLAISIMGARQANAQDADLGPAFSLATVLSTIAITTSETKLDAPKIVEDATAYVLDSNAEVGPHLAAFIEEVRKQEGSEVATDLEIAKAILAKFKKNDL